MSKLFNIIILSLFCCVKPAFSEVPVIEDSEHFTMMEEAQAALEDSLSNGRFDSEDEESALVTDNLQNNPNEENAILLDKLQGLQQEVQELRGQLEIQAHDLTLLQQQQLAFYNDFEKQIENKLSENTHSSNKTKTPEVTQETLNNQVKLPDADLPPPKPKRNNPADEQISYLAAYELIKNKQYDKALVAMHEFTRNYPHSGYTANAQYWCGELYLIKKNYQQALKKFETVVQQFPSSSKTAPSLLKIGYVLAALDRKPEAKQRLSQVIRNYPDTPTAELAQIKLRSLNH